MWIAKCDKCGMTENTGHQTHAPEKWQIIGTQEGAYAIRYRTYLLCPACCEALGIPKEKPQETIADRLLEILGEIATEAAEEVVQS